MRVLILDNYDSFTYNLVQYLGELGAELDVVRNDVAGVAELGERRAHRAGVSAGPRPRGRVAGPVHPGRGRSVRRGDPGAGAGGSPGTRRLPRPPGDGPGVRR